MTIRTRGERKYLYLASRDSRGRPRSTYVGSATSPEGLAALERTEQARAERQRARDAREADEAEWRALADLGAEIARLASLLFRAEMRSRGFRSRFPGGTMTPWRMSRPAPS